MDERRRILAIEPYYGLSHRMFLDGYRRRSRNEVEVWELPPRKWKWRMRGSAWHFAERARTATGPPPDLVLASDFLNLADWRALAPSGWRDAPLLLYFHENQIGYPLAEKAPVEHHYGWINLSSALAADAVLFNSSWQRQQFLADVERVLRRMPDYVPEGLVASLRERSGVFPVGIDFEPHDALAGRPPPFSTEGPPRILWNHRWEWDKDPERFVDGLLRLAHRGVEFEVVVCGESFGKDHPAFERLRREVPGRIAHLGFVRSADEYRRLAASCDVVVSTARHEFFGVSVVEAMYLGCLPCLPADLSYLEIVPPHLHPLFLWRDDPPFPEFLEAFLARPPVEYAAEIRQAAARYDWRRLAPLLDDQVGEIVTQESTAR